MFDTVLIANRGEIARRIIRTCKEMGLRTVAVYSQADVRAAFVREADEAVLVGGAPAWDSYLSVERIVEAARATGAGAIHPGYGFLSEHEGFARACEAAGIVFIGPTADTIAQMGSKIAAKELMKAHGVPVVPGFSGGAEGNAAFIEAAGAIGFPILVKASAGGGGKGMRLVRRTEELEAALDGARREATAAFGDGALLIERYVDRPRHIEVQILGDAHGNLVHVFERECSIQRRHQKILEESPSPAVDPELRARLGDAAVRAGKALGYRSAGTVEFVMGADREFYFLEVNTRLQVEHPVTECVTGLDLVRCQIEVAMGHLLPFAQGDLRQRGAAIEARLYAEDPDAAFLPQTGTLEVLQLSEGPGIRLDAGVVEGDEVGIHYDPMLAKIIATGADRAEANRRLQRALQASVIHGVKTNLAFLARVIAHPAWQRGDIHTHFIDTHAAELLDQPTPPGLAADAARIATALRVRHLAGARPQLSGVPIGWRNNPGADPQLGWRLGETTLVCAWRMLDAATVLTTLGGEAEKVRVDGDAGWVHVTFTDRAIPAWVRALEPDWTRALVHLRGHTLALELPDPFARAAPEIDAGSCRAPMPGRVISVRCEAGQAVVAGQALVVLEAMKMEHTLEAPADGTVEAVLCAVGDVVAASAELIRFTS